MAKFLNTTGVSYLLEELLKNTSARLLLISPYLQFNDRIKEYLQNLQIHKREIIIVFREDKLSDVDRRWLSEQPGIKAKICKTLHAKCYINESEGILTSMNLYEFSQINNNEMGIHLTKKNDQELFNQTLLEAERLVNISTELSFAQDKTNPAARTVKSNQQGYCIRTGTRIPFNIEKPLSLEAFKKWNEYANDLYPENFCHFSGESSNGQTSVSQPILKKNWKAAKERFNL